MLLNVMVTADWEFIIMRKQLNVEKNNISENSLHVNHGIKVGGKVLIIDKIIHRKLDCPTLC